MPLALLANLPWKWIGIAIAVAGLLFFVHHDGAVRERAKWEAAIAVQKQEAAQLLAASEVARRAAEDQWAASQRAANDRFQNDQAAIAAAGSKYHGIVAQLMRERKAGRGNGCGNQVPGDSGPAEVGHGPDPGQPDVLSGQPQSRLEFRYGEADAILARLRECRAERIGLGK